MNFVSAKAQAWVEYLTHKLENMTSLKELDAFLAHATDELDSLVKTELVDNDEANDSYNAFLKAYDTALERLVLLNRIKGFCQDDNPKECQHKHERNGTGVFYNSVKAIQCCSCGNWQHMKKAIN
mgnify:CR=1 FL=1